MPHPNEPSIEELKKREKELITSESTEENMKRVKAIGIQIQRLKKEIETRTE